ncbi:sulfatase-like hydrolase/transferase [Pontiellaceae bacterium B12227]|nr:sulfatase-like hydrolase/transferase [Pontiellaceae bacterium B12227]
MLKTYLIATAALSLTVSTFAGKQPNVLWVLTDDHRYDSVRAFNKMLTGQEMSKLGYVESPHTDRLAEMGTTFINSYCQAQGCAPSRASMHYGRYPFRSGVYQFEYHNNNAEHFRPTLPERMADLGYQTVHIGKTGVRVKTVKNGKAQKFQMYQTDFDSKTLAAEGLTEWGKGWASSINGKKLPKPVSDLEFFVNSDGEFEYFSDQLAEMKPEYAGAREQYNKKYDLLRFYKAGEKGVSKSMIIGGVSPRPAGKTRDGYYSSVFADFLQSEDKPLTVGSKSYDGVDTSKPLFCHIGYDFPHTPVLPPVDYRARFSKKKYKVPEFNLKELETMPKQLKKQVDKSFTDDYPEADKQTMIQDYYAFCAYGDTLIGQATEAFVQYSKKQKQPWMIVYVCGDHGWKLNEHGAISKFTPWDIDSHNPVIVVSSDKKAFPAGKVVTDYTELVDIAPTVLAAAGVNLADKENDYLDGYDLAEVASGKMPAREYVLGESHHVIGPRAFIRTKDYVFSMQTRPNTQRGKDMDWAKTASWKELDPALYHMSSDPNEINNLAFNPEYKQIAETMQQKLFNIVMGDNRVEVNWGKQADGTEIFRRNFAPGADDKKLTL